MLHIIRRKITQETVESVSCDKCGKIYSANPASDDFMEVQEFHHIDFTGGYSSVFGDMTRVQCDLCQQCLKDIVGPYCRYNSE
jgi:hypothetical protein